MLFYLPEKISNKNSFIIGLKFYDRYDNAIQRPFIDQLKSRKIINKYFWTMIFYENSKYDGAFLFGDILNNYYTRIENYSFNRLVYTYKGRKKLMRIQMEIMTKNGVLNLMKYIMNYQKTNNEYINNFVFSFLFYYFLNIL